MFRIKIYCTIFFTYFYAKSFALECPAISAPKCPISGIKILDETYPTQSFVISAPPMFGALKQLDKVPSDFALKIMESYDFKSIPQIIILTDNKSTFNQVKATIKKSLELENKSPQEIDKILNQITHANAQGYTFIQDPFLSIFSDRTGHPQISLFDSFNQDENHKDVQSALITSEISKSVEKCGGELSPSIPKDPSSFHNAEMGGNIQAAPGGLCLVGNNLGETNANKICGKNNIVKIHTSWLDVGHVDEILKVIPTNKNDGRPKECQFAIMSASPKKALELLSVPSSFKRNFISFSKGLDTEELFKEKIVRCSSSGRWNLYFDNIAIKKSKEIFFKEIENSSKTKSVL